MKVGLDWMVKLCVSASDTQLFLHLCTRLELSMEKDFHCIVVIKGSNLCSTQSLLDLFLLCIVDCCQLEDFVDPIIFDPFIGTRLYRTCRECSESVVKAFKIGD